MIHLVLQFAVGGFATATALASYATFAPRSRIWGPVISHGTTDGKPRVALTFDDGPTAGATDCILDILQEFQVKAAFFVIGRNVEREPQLLRQIDAEGHLIGNHTYDHLRWGAASHGQFWREQLDKTDDAIERVIGRRPLLFRPPIGHKTPFTIGACRQSGHSLVTWNARGWDGLATTTSQQILHHVLPSCRPGAIVMLHDGAEPGRRRDASPTIDALRPIIKSLRERGIEPVRLDELTGLRAYA
jgi:peptidoglycan/xylan/chitin deacetylase (PgdA/CDA1 family)